MDITGLRTDTRYLISPQLTSASYPDTDVDRNLNFWYREVLGWVIPLGGEWEMQGEIMWIDGQTGVTDYEIPSNLLRLYRVEAKLNNNAEFVECVPYNIAGNDIVEGNSTRVIDDVTKPTVEVFGDYLQIRPTFTEDVVNGLKIYVQEDFNDLTAVSPYTVPNLMNPVRRVLSLGAAYDFALSEEMWQKAAELKRRLYGDPSKRDDNGAKGQVIDLYSVKAGQRRGRVQAHRQNYR